VVYFIGGSALFRNVYKIPVMENEILMLTWFILLGEALIRNESKIPVIEKCILV